MIPDSSHGSTHHGEAKGKEGKEIAEVPEIGFLSESEVEDAINKAYSKEAINKFISGGTDLAVSSVGGTLLGFTMVTLLLGTVLTGGWLLIVAGAVGIAVGVGFGIKSYRDSAAKHKKEIETLDALNEQIKELCIQLHKIDITKLKNMTDSIAHSKDVEQVAKFYAALYELHQSAKLLIPLMKAKREYEIRTGQTKHSGNLYVQAKSVVPDYIAELESMMQTIKERSNYKRVEDIYEKHLTILKSDPPKPESPMTLEKGLKMFGNRFRAFIGGFRLPLSSSGLVLATWFATALTGAMLVTTLAGIGILAGGDTVRCCNGSSRVWIETQTRQENRKCRKY